MRVREALRDTGGQARALDEPVHRNRGEGERLLVAVAAQAHEQRLLVEQPNLAREGMDLDPCLEGLLDGLGHGDLAFAPALPADVEAVMAGVGPRTAQIPRAQTPELGRAQPAV